MTINPLTRWGALAVVIALSGAVAPYGAITARHATHQAKPRPAHAAPQVITGALINHGGPVQSAPRVYIDYWGWTSDPSGEQSYLNRFMSMVGDTPWLATVDQYSGGSPSELLAGTWSDPASVPTVPTDAQIQAEAASAATHFGAGKSVNVQIVVATPSGHSSSGFGTSYCAYHGAVSSDPSITYTDLPYMTDAGAACGEDSVNGSGGLLDGVSIIEGHELAEAITDPLLTTWYDAGGNEIGDKCAWSNLADITTSTGSFAVQPLWSNAANGCVLPTSDWFGPADLAGSLGSAPTAAAHSNGEQDVFWKGTDSNLWEMYFLSGWHGPVNIGMGPLGSAPTAVVRSSGEVDVFWKGTDSNLWEAKWNGSTWAGPTKLPVYIGSGSAPAAAAWGTEVDVFWKGGDNNLWETWQDGTGAWNGPSNLGGGPLGSAPTAAAHSNGEQDVFWEGTDGNIWEMYFLSGAWHGPVNIGMGQLESPPAAAVRPSNEVDLIWQGADGSLWESYQNGPSWAAPTDLHVYLGPPSTPTITAWGSEVDAFWKSPTNSDLWEIFHDGTS